MKKNKFLTNVMVHIKYPYTSLIIAVMWIGIAIIIVAQNQVNFEILVVATALCTLLVAISGFKVPK